MSTRAGRINPWVLGVGLALVLPLLALLASGFGNDPHEVPFVLGDQPAPAFTLVDLDGDTWSLDALQGRPVVLNFWSTWCGPCKVEHPLLQQTAALYPEVQFLGVIYSDTPEAARRYLARSGTSYDHLIDPEGRVAIDFGVTGVPETFFVDRHGTVLHKHGGAVNEPLMATMLKRMLGDG